MGEEAREGKVSVRMSRYIFVDSAFQWRPLVQGMEASVQDYVF